MQWQAQEALRVALREAEAGKGVCRDAQDAAEAELQAMVHARVSQARC